MIDTPATLLIDDAQRLRAGSAVSWAAILAGAATALATSIILFALGSGLGLASISPWANHGVSAATFAISGAIWLIVTQWLSSALGGYMAGRLRHRWLATNPHEIFFRDTAHGLLTWCVATIVVVALAGATVGSVTRGAARSGENMVGAGMSALANSPAELTNSPMDAPSPRGPAGARPMNDIPGVDKLFRGGTLQSSSGPDSPNARMESMHIAANALASGDMPADDRAYLASLIVAKTGVSPDEAQKRVEALVASLQDMQARAKAAADAARKAAAQTAIYTALAMLLGAFIASVAAALGGHLRDEHT
jgi:hypothetical protein